jgi:YHS domain-containing protein
MRWWCPMHAEITADKPGSKCDACGGMTLVPRIIQYRPPGKVLAIPETAVVDTGRHQVVYVERMPGMFEGVQVSLGPRCGSAFPVFAGLEPGQRVVSQGAFLVDAEARLNPSVAVGYFGATPQAANAPRSAETPVVGEKDLAGPDQKLIVAQRICPVTGKPLGSMGAPVRVELSGRVLFVCCEACETPLRDQPMKYLKRLGETAFPDAKARNQGPP